MKKNIIKIVMCSVFSAFSLISYRVNGLEKASVSVDSIESADSRLLSALDKECNSTNFMVSPVSIEMAMMALAAEDRSGNVKRDILNFYGITDFKQYRNAANNFLINMKKKDIVNINNSIWYNVDNINNDLFQSHICNCLPEKHFFSKKYIVNNSNAVSLINSWVYKKTHGKISEIVDNSDFSSVILNATYFKKKWEKPFAKELTHKSVFYNVDGSTSAVGMMSNDDTYNYYSNENFEMVEIPYENNAASMYVFLPKKSINDFRLEWLEMGISNKKEKYLSLKLPRFKEETSLNLTEMFKSLGLKSIFDPGSLNGVQISDILHKTYIDVNEEGTEAAAVTGIITRCCLAPQFNINRPFIYVITESQTGKLLFAGKKLSF